MYTITFFRKKPSTLSGKSRKKSGSRSTNTFLFAYNPTLNQTIPNLQRHHYELYSRKKTLVFFNLF